MEYTVREQTLREGNIGSTLFQLALPILGAMFWETVFYVADAAWIGQSGVIDLAAVNLVSFLIWTMFSVAGIVTTGANSLISYKLGEAVKDEKCRQEASDIAQLSLFLAAVMGLIEMLILLFGGQTILKMMAGEQDNFAAVLQTAVPYLKSLAIFAPIVCLNQVFASIMRAYGDTKTPSYIISMGYIINFILDPLFIVGFGNIFPGFDALGVAIAYNISCYIVFVTFLYKFTKGGGVFILPKTRPAWNWHYVGKIFAIGLPLSFASIVFSLIYMAISPMINRFGPSAIAALGIGHRIESINYMLCSGLSMACITMIAHNLGAGYFERAKATAIKALSWCFYLNIFFVASFWLIPDVYASFFTSDPEVQANVVKYFKIIAFSEFFYGAGTILDGIFAGGSRTLPPTVVNVICFALRWPLCLWAVSHLNLGLSSIWLTFTVTTIVGGLINFGMFFMGWWHKPLNQIEEKAA